MVRIQCSGYQEWKKKRFDILVQVLNFPLHYMCVEGWFMGMSKVMFLVRVTVSFPMAAIGH